MRMEHLLEFRQLSVREPNGKKWLEQLTGKEIPIIPDPVILMNKEEWEKAIPIDEIEEDFIFCYAFSYDDTYNNRIFQEISRKTGLPIYVINSRQWGLNNCGNKEFIGFDNSSNFESRVCLYHIYNEIGKATTKTDQIKVLIRNKFNGFQKKIGYIYKPTRNISFKKGFVYWSLTEDAIKYILINEKNIKKIYKHSFCGDELFIQTLLYNSEFRKKIYNLDDEYESCLRFIKPALSWNKDFSGGSIELAKKSENSITVSDLPMLVKSEKLYGWKFVGEQGIRYRKIKLK